MHCSRTLTLLLALNRKRLERAAGLTALATALLPAAPAAAQAVTVTDLTPAGNTHPAISGVSGNSQVGYSDSDNTAYAYGLLQSALLWHGTAESVVDITPARRITELERGAEALAVSGDTQVGDSYGLLYDSDPEGGYYDSPFHAFLWHGTAKSAIDLHPAWFKFSRANAVSGDTQVGFGSNNTVGNSHALLWHGTAKSVVDLHPAGFDTSEAFGVSGDAQVGLGIFSDPSSSVQQSRHALLWHGTAKSVVDLNPAGYTDSEVLGVSGDTQVGNGRTNTGVFGHALLWHGTPESVVDLTPTGFDYSYAESVSGGVQVGLGQPQGENTSGNVTAHAYLWRGTAASAVDLHAFLPPGFIYSNATGVSGSGNVYDVVGNVVVQVAPGTSGATHLFLWHVVFGTSAAKPVVQHFNPASRTAGREGFTLAVLGTGFTNKSVIVWDGQAQSTTFVSPTKLTVQIPASMIAYAGTAKIMVNTPGVGISNSHVLVVMPRPTITGLTPITTKAGSAAFTLTVTGTGFRPLSFYAPSVVKWNGAELTTTYVSATKLTAQVPASLLTKSGTATVTVTTPQVATSAGKAFTVTQ